MPLSLISQIDSKTFQQSYAQYQRRAVMTVDKEPSAEILNWNDECRLWLKPEITFGTIEKSLVTNQLITTDSKIGMSFKGVDIKQGFNDGGGLDILLTLYEKPPFTSIPFAFDTTKLVILHQPELTQVEIDRGCTRPDYVINSLAIYHSIRGSMHTGSDAVKFKTCKFGHIYRMQMVDAKGNKAWANWSAPKNGLAYLDLDEKLLTDGVYPITIQPVGDTFGYTSAGASTFGVGAGTNPRALMYGAHTAGSGETVTKYSLYFSTGGDSQRVMNVSAYGITSSEPYTRLSTNASDAQITLAEYTAGKWVDSNTVSQNLSNGTNYCLAVSFNLLEYSAGLFYDTGTSGDLKRHNDANDLPATGAWTTDANYDYKLSLYATYTVSAGGTTYEMSITEGIKVSDSNTQNLTFGMAITEGLKGSDSPNGACIFQQVISDGFKLSDIATQVLSYFMGITEGLKISDTNSSTLTFNIQITEGVKLSDVLSTIGQFGMSLSEVIKVSDINIIYKASEVTVTVTIELLSQVISPKLNKRSIDVKMTSTDVTV
jgi:hypothetical protein